MLSMSRFSRLLLAVAAILGSAEFASAQGPLYGGSAYGYGFGYGSPFGYNSFQNHLPTPPYFSIYPPVYYGKRYARPYGDSPFAALPQLRSSPDYHAVPAEVPFRTRSVVNPHVRAVEGIPAKNASSDSEAPVAMDAPRVGKPQIVVNPYVLEQYVTDTPVRNTAK